MDRIRKYFFRQQRRNNWNGLFATIKLFRKPAETIAKELRYSYPYQPDWEMTEYVQKIDYLTKAQLITKKFC